MSGWSKIAALTLLCGLLSMPFSARAVDFMTMSSTAPQALDLASMWSPHAISAMQSGGLGLVKVGESALNILRLPLGLLECTLGYPFGFAEDGLNNCMAGLFAPFELVGNVMMLPVRIFSLGAVR